MERENRIAIWTLVIMIITGLAYPIFRDYIFPPIPNSTPQTFSESAVASDVNEKSPEPLAIQGKKEGTTVKSSLNDSADMKKTTLPLLPSEGDEIVVLYTSKGRISILLYPTVAPKTVENFLTLVKHGFYDGTRFHRCIPGFMIQGGDPSSKDLSKADIWGTGGYVDQSGKDVFLPDETGFELKHTRGVISMANAGKPETGSSQFFIMQEDYPSLDGGYTAFGRVIDGIEIVDLIIKSGSTDPALNGTVSADQAILLKKATVEKWHIE
ncbi:MAG: peptidylprolyl isomerase [Fimbriimonadaceae bacterium]|nr:MAG: peptidylprolyl isomerase [Fimbriimonadaceae bacterium]